MHTPKRRQPTVKWPKMAIFSAFGRRIIGKKIYKLETKVIVQALW